MAVSSSLSLVVFLLAASCCSAAGRDFNVGAGQGGWTTNPAEPFNRWAERNRFQVNDRVVFRYSSRDDSVLVVSRQHYDACNTTEPFVRLDGGESVFVLSNSGPFYFISGNPRRCQAGERLIIVVLAVRPKRDTTPPPPPAAKSSPPVPAPPAPQTSPPTPPAEGNSTSPGTAPAPPQATNATASPPSPSSAPAASRGRLLMCLVTSAAAAMFLA